MRWLALGAIIGTLGCAAARERHPVVPVWFCYPVDVHSGQQMCVRQVFTPEDSGGQ